MRSRLMLMNVRARQVVPSDGGEQRAPSYLNETKTDSQLEGIEPLLISCLSWKVCSAVASTIHGHKCA
jgi:hypothetical protein